MALFDRKNRDFMREITDWTKLQAEKERKEGEEKRDAWIQQHLSMQMQAMPQMLIPPLTYGKSLSVANAFGSLGSGTAWPAAQEDPHKLLISQIEQLKSAEPAKLSQRSPDFCQTITSYRGWTVKNEKLTALGQTGAWEPKKAKAAKCTSTKEHRAPSRDCQCGYWSFKSMDILTTALKSYTSNVVVVGQVEIWGRVIECENGWRSEFAYPKELWLLKPGLEHLSWDYGVPVRSLPRKKRSK